MAKSYTEELDISGKIDDAVVTRIAVGLKENWTFIDSLFDKDNNTTPTDKEYEQMAREIANSDDNSFMLDGERRSIEDVKKEALKKYAGNKDIQEQMTDLDIDIPDQEKRKNIASAVEKGVNDNTGIFSNIKHFIMGLINWIAGFFNGKNETMGFSLQLIAQITVCGSYNVMLFSPEPCV